MLKITDMGNLV